MKRLILTLVVFLAACGEIANTDVKFAEYLCDGKGWTFIEAKETMRKDSRRVQVLCKDNSTRIGFYNKKEWDK
jgi:hypothetical protein